MADWLPLFLTQVKQNTMKAIYRILDANGRVMYTGGNSWMTLQQARNLVNYSKGEMIYEYSEDYQNRLFEVF